MKRVNTQGALLSRRRFLALAGGVVVATGCAPGRSPSDGAMSPVARGGSFAEPAVLTSGGGELAVTLRAGPADYAGAVDGALAYNDAPVGPTWRVRPGDRITVDLENGLDVATNLHTHGLAVSPQAPSDDVFAVVEAGESRRHVYEIPPDHRSGTFWYHPHLHGSVAQQVAAGLFGAIIVDDHLDDDGLGVIPERLFVLNDPVGVGGDLSPMDEMHGRGSGTVRVNGVAVPRIDADAGSIERWRVVNASASRSVAVAMPDAETHLIASDGGRLSEPRSVGGVVLVPGERAELVVVMPDTPGELLLDDGRGGGLATVNVTVPDRPGAPNAVPARLAAPSTLETGTVDRQRTLRLGVEMGSGSMMSGRLIFTIDGEPFDPARTDVEVDAGATEEWTIVNDTGMNHPFHLHAWAFRVAGEDTWPGWKDTVDVPGGGQVTIIIPFTGTTGRSVYHCHILDHEDLGMMGVIDVRPR